MIVVDVMAEIGTKLDTISGLRVFPYWADDVPTPAAIVALPDEITFDETYGRGADRIVIPVLVLVAAISDRTGHKEASAYMDGSGASSVKAKLDSTNTNTYTSCDVVRVASAENSRYKSVAGVTLLGVNFTVEIFGQGS